MKYNNLIPNEIRTHFDIIEVKKIQRTVWLKVKSDVVIQIVLRY